MGVLNEKEISVINEVQRLFDIYRKKQISTSNVLEVAQEKRDAQSELLDFLERLPPYEVITVMAVMYVGRDIMSSEDSPETLLVRYKQEVKENFDGHNRRITHMLQKPTLNSYLKKGIEVLQ